MYLSLYNLNIFEKYSGYIIRSAIFTKNLMQFGANSRSRKFFYSVVELDHVIVKGLSKATRSPLTGVAQFCSSVVERLARRNFILHHSCEALKKKTFYANNIKRILEGTKTCRSPERVIQKWIH
jgi:hypothetical protein